MTARTQRSVAVKSNIALWALTNRVLIPMPTTGMISPR